MCVDGSVVQGIVPSFCDQIPVEVLHEAVLYKVIAIFMRKKETLCHLKGRVRV